MPPKRKAASKVQAPANVDFTKLKVTDLKAELSKRGLDTSGRKEELVNRLTEDEAGGKKIKIEEPEEKDVKPTLKEKLLALADEEKKTKKTNQREVDQYCSLSNAQVHQDYDCMLNQTNIGQNNNKYYVIQMLDCSGSYYVWNRWGRVGEPGANALKGPFVLEAAIKDFEKKFKDKTRNDWNTRDDFKPVKGKYTLLEIDTSDEAATSAISEKSTALDKTDGPAKKTRPCKLDQSTQQLLGMLFNNDMFKEAMEKMNLDVKKMPLGKLSKSQVAKGFEVLEEIEKALETSKIRKLADLTSQFYTVIPHNFGRQRPPVIDSMDVLRKKMEMLTVLGDIEIAQTLKREEEDSQCGLQEIDHPLDVNYSLLNTNLELVDKKSKEFKFIKNYTDATKGYRSNLKILDVWKVNRYEEGERFAVHDDIENRKLLWHGTNVAVVVAILKSGLRLMPHSGGRVGRGIYFASENGKSSAYVGTTSNNIGIMFLNEVALGKEKEITRDDSSLKSAPTGFDSVVAKGRTEPNPIEDIKIELEEKMVVVPQGKPTPQSEYNSSSFSESEYLVYKESQARIRYLLKLKF